MKTLRLTHPGHQTGFSLIELMITVVIIGILASIALPSYSQYIIRGHRAAAQAQMIDIGNREQQFLLANRQYAAKTTLESNGYSLPSDLASRYSYDVTVDNAASPPSFTIIFTATGSQASDGNLSLTSTGVKSPANKW